MPRCRVFLVARYQKYNGVDVILMRSVHQRLPTALILVRTRWCSLIRVGLQISLRLGQFLGGLGRLPPGHMIFVRLAWSSCRMEHWHQDSSFCWARPEA